MASRVSDSKGTRYSRAFRAMAIIVLVSTVSTGCSVARFAEPVTAPGRFRVATSLAGHWVGPDLYLQFRTLPDARTVVSLWHLEKEQIVTRDASDMGMTCDEIAGATYCNFRDGSSYTLARVDAVDGAIVVQVADTAAIDRLVAANQLARNDAGVVTSGAATVRELMTSGRLTFRPVAQMPRLLKVSEEFARAEIDAWGNADKRACDAIAGSYVDPFTRGGVAVTDSARALAVCERATANQSVYHPRYTYLKGRAALEAKDVNAALAAFTQGIRDGYPAAFFALGSMYRTGNGVAKDPAKAIDYFKMAAERGVAYAETALAGIYARGEGVEANEREALRWYSAAASHGDAFGMLIFAEWLANGTAGLTQDYARASELLTTVLARTSAEGDTRADAAIDLGFMAEHGRGRAPDLTAAVAFYRQAADLGSARGQTELGRMLFEGKGVERSYEQAAELFARAAGENEPVAQLYLGYQYMKGLGVQASYPRAQQWLRASAEAKNASAMFFMGILDRDAIEGPRSVASAMQWFERGAAGGDGRAQLEAAIGYYQGTGVTQDYRRAAQLAASAAQQQQPRANLLLAYMYEQGLGGLPRSASEAESHFREAAKSSDTRVRANAIAALDRAESARQARVVRTPPPPPPPSSASSDGAAAVVGGILVLGALAYLLSPSEATTPSEQQARDAEAADRAREARREREEAERFVRERRIVERASCSYRGGYWFDGTGLDIGFCTK